MKFLKKAGGLLLAFFFVSSLIYGQSLVELAKKEKERRAKLKKKSAVVVTNADLAYLKKRPSIQVSNPPPYLEEKPPTSPSSPQVRVTNRTPQPQSSGPKTSSATGKLDQQDTSLAGGSLEEKLKKAQEMVGLLTLKMNALWQEFYSLDDMTPRDLIQKQISETYLQLQKAQAEVDKLKKQLATRQTNRKK